MENKEQSVVSNFVNPVEINGKEDVKENVNKAREEFLQTHAKVQKFNRIVSGIFFVLTFGLIILGNTVSKLLGLCIGIVCVGFLFVWLFTRKQRKMLDEAVAVYLYNYSLYCNSYIFENVDNVEIGYKEKPEVEDVKKLNISDDVTVINSRDVVKGKLEGKEFISADVSLKTGHPRKEREQKALFVGKVYMLNYSFKDEGRTLLYLKGCGDAAPTKLNDVNKVDVDGLKKDWEVYSSSKNYSKIFNSAMTKTLNKISCNNTLNDVVISISEDKVLVGFSYSDEAMIIPMNREYETKHLEIKRENFESFKEINKILLDNSEFKK